MKRKFDWIFRGVFLLLIAFFAGFGCSSEYEKWMENELSQNESSVRRNIEKHLNGATISSASVQDSDETSIGGDDCVVFTLKVGWKGAYNTSGTADINYVCKIVGDQLQFRNLEIVSSDNPTVEEYCKVVAATHDAEVISDPNCDIRRRVERKHSVSVNKAYTSEFRVKTTGNTNDCGINGSNITAVSVTYHMDWDGGYSEISYFYNVKNGKWEHVNSGITKTSDTTPGIIDKELVDTIIRNLPIIIDIVMMLSQG